jgi:cell wall-associated NlpC family hydrolase
VPDTSVVLPAALKRAARLAVVPLLSGGLLTSGLITAPAAEAAPVVRTATSSATFKAFGYGSRGPSVVYVQRALGVRTTGYYGRLTRAAVKRFQVAKRLRATGYVDARTWTAIKRHAVAKARASRSAARVPVGSVAFQNKVLGTARATARGARYVRGATGPKRFDCSGFVGYVYRNGVRVSLPRASYQMRAATKRISASQVRPGDLVFVNNGRGGRVGHVAIYAGKGYWWEASNPRTGVGLHKAWSRNVSYGRA